jgi:prenyltransferase beta subunit
VIRKAEEMLLTKRGHTDSPFNVATTLSTLTALGHPPDDEYFSELVDWLIEAQRLDGGWNWFGDLPSNPSQMVDCLVQLSTFVEIDGT